MTTPHDFVKKQLEQMSNEDYVEMLKSDPLYQMVIKSAPQQDREKIEQLVVEFLNSWKSGAVDGIIGMASDPEFVRIFMKMMSSQDPNGGVGDLI